MKNKYSIEKLPIVGIREPYNPRYALLKNGARIAIFDSEIIDGAGGAMNNASNAQKVCDLLNETSRSKGDWPK